MKKKKINWQDNPLAKMQVVLDCPAIESPEEALEILSNYLLGENWYGEGSPSQVRYQIVEAILEQYSPKYNKEMKDYQSWKYHKEQAELNLKMYQNTVQDIKNELTKK